MTELSADLALADAEARESRERVTVDDVMRLACIYRVGNGPRKVAKDKSALRTAVEALARAALAPAVPPGWKMVPVEPTLEMAQALLDYSGEDELPWPTDVSPNYALAAYRILIAAAPSAKEPTCPKD